MSFPQRRQWNARLFLHLLPPPGGPAGAGISSASYWRCSRNAQGTTSLASRAFPLSQDAASGSPTSWGGRGTVGPAVGWRAEAAPALRRVPAGLLHPKREPSVCVSVCARSRVCARARVCVCARAGSAPGTTPALQRDNTAATAPPTRVLPGMPMTNPRPPNAVSPVTRLESAKFPTAPGSPLGN